MFLRKPSYRNLEISLPSSEMPVSSVPEFKVYFSFATVDHSQIWRRTYISPRPRNEAIAQQTGVELLCQSLSQNPINEILWNSVDWKIMAETHDDLMSRMPTVVHLRSLLAGECARSRGPGICLTYTPCARLTHV